MLARNRGGGLVFLISAVILFLTCAASQTSAAVAGVGERAVNSGTRSVRSEHDGVISAVILSRLERTRWRLSQAGKIACRGIGRETG